LSGPCGPLCFLPSIAILPPWSTLFPYTTLFRSCISKWGHDFRPSYQQVIDKVLCLPQDFAIAALTATATVEVQKDIMERLHISGDRKSTRLNSSHVSISYAVFCLKKKTRSRPPP